MLIGQSPAIRRVLSLIDSVACSDVPVLLGGESGTGKEEAAKEIHRRSGLRGRYLAINCAAISETLIESQLFGHERGAYTGADRKLEGLFEQADGGTVFLDEIGEMKIELQAKLLRVLEERQATRLGGSEPIPFRVRLVAASNRSLRAGVSEGTMRDDLFYRLSTFEIDLPPLRKRPSDIQLLAEHFWSEHNRRNGTEIEGMDADCLATLKAYPWPGNIRELKNAIERGAIICKKGLLAVSDLPDHVLRIEPEEEPFTFRVGMTLGQVEREVIRRTLIANRGNRLKTASMLRIARGTVYRALADCDLGDSQKGSLKPAARAKRSAA